MSAALVSPVAAEQRAPCHGTTAASSRRSRKTFCAAGPRPAISRCPSQTCPPRNARRSRGCRQCARSGLRPPPHIAPAREGIIVPIPPGVLGAEEDASDVSDRRLSIQLLAAAPRHRARAQLLVGRPRPVVRARPRAEGPRRRTARPGPRSSCTAFSCCASRLDEALEKKLAGLGVELLGPHDDHHKARLPVGVARGDRGAAGGRVGRGERAGAEAEPRADRASGLSGARRPSSTPRRRSRSSSISSRAMRAGSFRRQLEAAGAAVGRVRRRAPLLSRGGHRADHRQDRRPRLRAVRRADRADVRRARPEHAADRRRHDPPGQISYGLTRFGGASIPVGILDTRLHDRARSRRSDDKNGCGPNFTNDAAARSTTRSGTARTCWARSPAPAAPTAATGAWPRAWERPAVAHQGRQDLEERQHAGSDGLDGERHGLDGASAARVRHAGAAGDQHQRRAVGNGV